MRDNKSYFKYHFNKLSLFINIEYTLLINTVSTMLTEDI